MEIAFLGLGMKVGAGSPIRCPSRLAIEMSPPHAISGLQIACHYMEN
jgi:hypothetical protein